MCDSIWFDFPYDWMRVTYQFMRVKLKLFWVVFINGLIIFFRRSLFTRTLTWICIYIYAFPFPLSFCWDWQILHKPHIIIPMILLQILANISHTNLFTWLPSWVNSRSMSCRPYGNINVLKLVLFRETSFPPYNNKIVDPFSRCNE